ncbi:MAG: hypothetical protein ACI8RZ_005882 [Myxococcota bacterium]|jgi:hypothetical protein
MESESVACPVIPVAIQASGAAVMALRCPLLSSGRDESLYEGAHMNTAHGHITLTADHVDWSRAMLLERDLHEAAER